MTAQAYRQWGVFSPDGRLIGTWLDEAAAMQQASAAQYLGHVVRWRDTTHTAWAPPAAPRGPDEAEA